MSETDVSGEDKSKLIKENNIAPNTRELVTAEEEGQENVSEDEEPEESQDHPSHLLVQGDPLDALMQPVRSSTRVKVSTFIAGSIALSYFKNYREGRLQNGRGRGQLKFYPYQKKKKRGGG